MTTPATVQASEAADRLREVIRPGDTVYMIEFVSRSGDTSSLRLFAVKDPEQMLRVTDDAAHVLGMRVNRRHCGIVLGAASAGHLLDRLSVALFGEPGQVKGEYL